MPHEQRGDPDAQTTINDFQDYTEYLPSDLTRSLTLIGKLDTSYIERAGNVHLLTKQYGEIPKLPLAEKPDLDGLRKEISFNLNQAILARESAYGEATRLHELVDRHYKRLQSVASKLKALPKPPSRDPTPVARSPQATQKTPPTRITLRLDSSRHAASTGRAAGQAHKPRDKKRRITVPGEVLPPPNPDSPTSFTASDWESVPPSPLPMPTSRVGGSSSRHKKKPVRLRPPKPPKRPKERLPRPPRAPGSGTNVHSQVAGISTSNALSLLPAPPADAQPGSEHAPWMRLTEYEMAKLRKRMKKNAIWSPSETMIRRELADSGRGPENYRLRKAEAEEKGEDFLDVDNIAEAGPGKPLGPGEISAESLGDVDSNLSNRGMKLNEAKKLKREAMLAASAEEMKAAANRVADLGSNFRELFSNPQGVTLSPSKTMHFQNEKTPKKDRHAAKEKPKDDSAVSVKKRKREDEHAKSTTAQSIAENATPSEVPRKKNKVAPEQPSPTKVITETITTTVPLAAPAPSPQKEKEKEKEKEPLRSPSKAPSTPTMPAPDKPEKPKTNGILSKHPVPTATASRPRRISLTLKGPSDPPPSGTQTSPHTAIPIAGGRSRSVSRRGSAGPPSATLPRDYNTRHASATPTTPITPGKPVTAASRRSKRPAPGAVVKDQDGGATVSVGKRPHAPKKGAGNASKDKDKEKDKENASATPTAIVPPAAGEVWEEIDPNEPRYCLCGGVSYGEMVGCDNDDVSSYPTSVVLLLLFHATISSNKSSEKVPC